MVGGVEGYNASGEHVIPLHLSLDRCIGFFCQETAGVPESPLSLDGIICFYPQFLLERRAASGTLEGAGMPMWRVISGDEIVERAYGPSQWQGTVLPRLRQLLR